MYTVGLDTSALDSGFKEHAARGIGRYVQELDRYFKNTQSSQVQVKTFNHKMVVGSGFTHRMIESLPAGRATVRQQVMYPFKLGKCAERFDVVHFPAHMDAPSWSPKQYAITVLDLIPLVLADMYKADKPSWRFHLARWLEIRAIKNASLVLAISQHTADDVHRVLGIPYEKIVVTPLGVDKKFFEINQCGTRQDFEERYGIAADREIILYVGGIDARKNYASLIEVLKRVKAARLEKGQPVPQLVMVGKIQKDAQYPKLLSLIERDKLGEDVVMAGYVPDDELMQLYSLSSVFYFPSLYEGFGLTPLEAMAAGTPVVSSSRSAMKEVLEDAACIVDPEDYDQAASSVQDVLDNPQYAQQLREQGKQRAALFTWQRTGELTAGAYERLFLGAA